MSYYLNYVIPGVVAFAVMVFAVGLAIGAASERRSIAKDCELAGAFRAADKAFICGVKML